MGLDRRGFIQFAIGGAVGTLLTPIPWKLTDDLAIWSQNWQWIPRNIKGATEYKTTVSKLCPSGCGLSVRTVGGLPVKVEGDPEHPLSKGGVSPLAAAEVQMLYSPARVKRPLRRTSDGAYVALSWEAALDILEEKLGSLKGGRNKLACLSGDEAGTINEVLSGLLAGMGSSSFFILPGEVQPSRAAWQELMRGRGQVGYDIENSDFVLAVGADILESWGTVVRNRRAFSASRPHGEDPTAIFVYAGAVENNTAVGADQWIAIRPGTEGVFLLGLCNLLIQSGKSVDFASDFADFAALAAAYTPAKTAAATGCSESALKDLAKALAKASKPLVMAGSPFGYGAGAGLHAAGIAANLLLGNLNREGGLRALPEPGKAVPAAMDRAAVLGNDFASFVLAAAKGKAPEALIVYEANPLHALPLGGATAKALENVSFKVSFSCFMDETASTCDLVLPTPMGLERWDDICNPYGSGSVLYSLARPVTEPLADVRPAGDVLLYLGRKLGVDLGFGSFLEVLEAKAKAVGADFDALAENGGAYVSDTTEWQPMLSMAPGFLAKALPLADAPDGLTIAPVAYLRLGSRYAPTPPFNLKTIREDELLGKRFFVHMNRATAGRLGLSQGDLVSVKSGSGRITAKVDLHEGVMTGVVAAPLGFGHTAYDAYSGGKGDNAAELLKADFEPGTGLPVLTGAEVNIILAFA